MDQTSTICLWLAYLLYAAAFAVFVVAFFTQRPGLNRLGLMAAAVSLVFHTAALITRGVSAGHFPFVGAYESLMLVSWAIALVWHVLESFTKIKAVGLYVMPVVLVLLTLALVEYEAPRSLVPALKSDIVILHVAVMLVAIGCLYVAGGAALIYLVEEALLRRRRPGGVLGRLPSLATLDRLIYHATLLGVPFLTMGMAAGVDASELEPSSYSYSGDGAIAHLFRVTSSLDSMVVGEAQIVAQMKAAYQQACEGGCTSVVFNRLFRHALEVGKRVRTETAIGERPVSVSSAAVELALQVFGTFKDHTALIVGAGETSELTATHLKAHGIENILVTNRTFGAAEELAHRVGGRAVPFEDLEGHLAADPVGQLL